MYQQQQQLMMVMMMVMMVTMLFFASQSTGVDGATSVHAPPDYFNDFYTSTTGGLDFVLRGNDVDVPCIPEKDNKLKIEEPIYSWSNNSEYKEVSLSHYPKWRTKPESGVLLVKDAQLNQSGKYYCSMRSRVRKAEPVTYEHNLAVYQLPEYTMKWMIYHLTKRCDNKAGYKNYVKDVLRMLCLGVKDCVWSFTYDSCIASGADLSKSKWDLMKSWTAGSQSDLIVSFVMTLKVAKDYRAPQCDLICITKNVMSHLETEFKPKVLSFKSLSRDVYRESLDLTFLEQKMTQEMTLYCPPGYDKYKTEVCMPCFPGRSKSGKADETCDPCGYFGYQPHFASTKCIACPPMKLTGRRGADNSDFCYLYFKNVIFWVIIVLVITICAGPMCVFGFYYMRWREDEMYCKKKCDKCCGFGGQFGTTKHKMYRHFDEDPSALPQLFEAPQPIKKPDKVTSETMMEFLGGKKKKVKQEEAGKKKTDDKSKSKSKPKQETIEKKEKKSAKGTQKSSAKSSKAPSQQQQQQHPPHHPPDFIPPHGMPLQPGFYPPPPPVFPPYQEYPPPPPFYYPPPELYYDPNFYPPGPVHHPPAQPPVKKLTPKERAALGLPPEVPRGHPVNLKDFEASDDGDDW